MAFEDDLMPPWQGFALGFPWKPCPVEHQISIEGVVLSSRGSKSLPEACLYGLSFTVGEWQFFTEYRQPPNCNDEKEKL